MSETFKIRLILFYPFLTNTEEEKILSATISSLLAAEDQAEDNETKSVQTIGLELTPHFLTKSMAGRYRKIACQRLRSFVCQRLLQKRSQQQC
jgi:hypothetical protein